MCFELQAIIQNAEAVAVGLPLASLYRYLGRSA
jgi:hypothetical protein